MMVVLIGIWITLFFAACAFCLARLSSRIIPRANRLLRILISAMLFPIALFVSGFIVFVESDLVDWLASRPISAWVNCMWFVLVSGLAARYAIRREPAPMDASIFK